MAELKSSWNELYYSHAHEDVGILEIGGTNSAAQIVGYWQWATSNYTRMYFDDAESITKVVPTVVGYPEFYHWKWEYF